MDKNYKTIEGINDTFKNTMIEVLGIKCTELGSDYLYAQMPVDERTFQPNRILHGGATIALAETIAGILSHALIDFENYESRGIQVNANHIKSIKEGYVYAKAKLIHTGKKTHLVEVKITDKNEKLISTCRVTNIILKRRK